MNEQTSMTLWALGCLLSIGIFFFAWKKEFFQLKKDTLAFFPIYMALLILFCVSAVLVIIFADDPNMDWIRYGMFAFACATLGWNGAWCSDLRMKNSENY